ISAVEPLLRTRNQRTMAAEVLDVGAAPLAVVLFRMLARPDRRPPVVRTEARGLAPALSAIEERLHVEIADEVFAKRFLRVYGKDELYVIKPAELRYWTRSAALNDADEILAEHLGAERGMQ
ncbi:MAG TPA: SAM-dependent methyltransferase, partial [Phycisphaerae bacterium]|nr:SAM-dependent methyltransferase [Phycisphaerae bacterium]